MLRRLASDTDPTSFSITAPIGLNVTQHHGSSATTSSAMSSTRHPTKPPSDFSEVKSMIAGVVFLNICAFGYSGTVLVLIAILKNPCLRLEVPYRLVFSVSCADLLAHVAFAYAAICALATSRVGSEGLAHAFGFLADFNWFTIHSHYLLIALNRCTCIFSPKFKEIVFRRRNVDIMIGIGWLIGLAASCSHVLPGGSRIRYVVEECFIAYDLSTRSGQNFDDWNSIVNYFMAAILLLIYGPTMVRLHVLRQRLKKRIQLRQPLSARKAGSSKRGGLGANSVAPRRDVRPWFGRLLTSGRSHYSTEETKLTLMFVVQYIVYATAAGWFIIQHQLNSTFVIGCCSLASWMLVSTSDAYVCIVANRRIRAAITKLLSCRATGSVGALGPNGTSGCSQEEEDIVLGVSVSLGRHGIASGRSASWHVPCSHRQATVSQVVEIFSVMPEIREPSEEGIEETDNRREQEINKEETAPKLLDDTDREYPIDTTRCVTQDRTRSFSFAQDPSNSGRATSRYLFAWMASTCETKIDI